MQATASVASAAATMLDTDMLDSIATTEFRQARPYPWLNPVGVLRPEAFDLLRANLPPLELMQASFGRKRAHGQQPHDRYALEYHPGLQVNSAWHQLVSELDSARYRDFIARLFDCRRFSLSYHWHYAPRGCSVSPHCDARRKLGSHIFYFNTTEDWDPEWGGETLVLDDCGRLARGSSPGFDDFDSAIAAQALGNRSFLFQRQGNSWHGVKPLLCPEDRMRKVFIVVINSDSPLARLRRLLHRPEGY